MSWLPPLPPTFEAALRDVRARGAQAREAAARRLASPDAGRASEAADGLFVLARDAAAAVRIAALGSLRELAPANALEVLIDCTADRDARVRELAVVALGALRGSQVERALIDLLQSDHPEVRFQALQSYADACAAPQPSVLYACLSDSDPEVRTVAAHSCRALGEQARDALVSALGDSARSVRAEAALALAALGDRAGEHALIEALDDPELLLDALDAIGALALHRARDAVAVLASSMLRPPLVKAAAGRALCRMGDALGVVALREVLRAFRSDGRSYAAETAGELGLTELVPDLVRLAGRRRGASPLALAEALVALLAKAPEARAGLERLARRDDEAAEVARAALAAGPSPSPSPTA